jgi:hypothetical protein
LVYDLMVVDQKVAFIPFLRKVGDLLILPVCRQAGISFRIRRGLLRQEVEILDVPEVVLKELRKKVDEEGIDSDGIIVEAFAAYLGVDDPEIEAEIHLWLSEKYLRGANELLAQGDHVQASEKAWGAAAQIIKADAAKKGQKLKSHAELHRYVSKLSAEIGNKEIGRLWRSAGMLHQNFYENWLPEEMVAESIEDVKEKPGERSPTLKRFRTFSRLADA